jgi:hypothetical protein
MTENKKIPLAASVNGIFVHIGKNLFVVAGWAAAAGGAVTAAG